MRPATYQRLHCHRYRAVRRENICPALASHGRRGRHRPLRTLYPRWPPSPQPRSGRSRPPRSRFANCPQGFITTSIRAGALSTAPTTPGTNHNQRLGEHSGRIRRSTRARPARQLQMVHSHTQTPRRSGRSGRRATRAGRSNRCVTRSSPSKRTRAVARRRPYTCAFAASCASCRPLCGTGALSSQSEDN